MSDRWKLHTWHQTEVNDGENRFVASAGTVEQAEQIVALHNANIPRPLEAWHEDIGPVLWWTFPIQEPPYCGTPLDDDWPMRHGIEPTHWTPLIVPKDPSDGAA